MKFLNRFSKDHEFYWNLIHGNFDKVIDMLNDGYNINKRNMKEETVLMRIARGKYGIDILKFLIDNHADVNAQDLNGNTPIMIALAAASDDRIKTQKIIQELIPRSDINIQNHQGDTALMIACLNKCIYENTEVIHTLLSANAIDIDKQNFHGWTALMFTSIYSDICSNYSMLNALLAENANLYIKNNERLNVLDIVRTSSYNYIQNSTCSIIILNNEIIRRQENDRLNDCLNRLNDVLTCGICNNRMNDPVITSSGDSYCRECLTEIDDLMTADNAITNNLINDLIKSMK